MDCVLATTGAVLATNSQHLNGSIMGDREMFLDGLTRSVDSALARSIVSNDAHQSTWEDK
eukprot:m.190885 g.190885  ORF g.190885 m.190885 type:complete len:60 (+) comp18577_c0_seq6:1627-1806(+)